MKSASRSFGDRGEDEAVAYLKKNGYRILARNYVSGRREIDIVATKKNTLAVIEVKTRTYTRENFERFGRAAAAVDADKRHNGAMGCLAPLPDGAYPLDSLKIQ